MRGADRESRVYDYAFLIVKSYSILPVENGAACHTHDTSFVQITSGSTLVCGFGYALRIRAYGSGFGRLACTFGKALQRQECAIVLGSCSFRESREKSREKGGRAVRPV